MGGLFQLRRLSFMFLWTVVAALLSHAMMNVAQATCGDYLMNDEDALQDARLREAAQFGDDEHPEMPCPCKGIGCRGVPHPVPAGPDRSLTCDLERWCTAPGDGLNPPRITSMVRARGVLLMSPVDTSRIDRPPRV